MKQLEEKFLNEIKPLVNQFIGMSKQKLDIKQRMDLFTTLRPTTIPELIDSTYPSTPVIWPAK